MRTSRELVNLTSMRIKAVLRLIFDCAALLFLCAMIAIPLGLIQYAANVEHERRIEVLTQGMIASATVTKSYKGWSSRGCLFEYRFVFNGEHFEGGEGGCPLVAKHPRGSSLKVRFDPADPQSSVAMGADVWPGWAIVPALLAVPLLVLGGLVLWAILRKHRTAPNQKPKPASK